MEPRNKALLQLRKSLRSGRGEEMPDMKKVSIIAPDEKGLKEGLKKAEEILPKISKMASEIEPEMEKEDDTESKDHEMSESKDYESGEDEAESEMGDHENMNPEDMSREQLIECVKKYREMK